MYGHAAALLRRCDHPGCLAPAVVADDDTPTILRCAMHALLVIAGSAARGA